MTTDGAYLVLIGKLNQVNAEAHERGRRLIRQPYGRTTTHTHTHTHTQEQSTGTTNTHTPTQQKHTPAPHSKVLVHKWPSKCLRIFRLIGRYLGAASRIKLPGLKPPSDFSVSSNFASQFDFLASSVPAVGLPVKRK